MNRTSASLHGGLIEIMLTVPLNVYYFENDCFIVHTNFSTFFSFSKKNNFFKVYSKLVEKTNSSIWPRV